MCFSSLRILQVFITVRETSYKELNCSFKFYLLMVFACKNGSSFIFLENFLSNTFCYLANLCLVPGDATIEAG